jgi:hypothetical protein
MLRFNIGQPLDALVKSRLARRAGTGRARQGYPDAPGLKRPFKVNFEAPDSDVFARTLTEGTDQASTLAKRIRTGRMFV